MNKNLYPDNRLYVDEKDICIRNCPTCGGFGSSWKIKAINPYSQNSNILRIEFYIEGNASATIFYDKVYDEFFKKCNDEFIKIIVETDKNIFKKKFIEKEQKELKERIRRNEFDILNCRTQLNQLNNQLSEIEEK